MQSRIWTVANDHDSLPFAYFSRKESAERYQRTLVERYSLGQSLALHNKPLAPDAGTWSLGLGPALVDRVIDESIDALPGAWVVKVDESCRMVACEFSTLHRTAKTPTHYRTGIRAICEAYGSTPHEALDRARKGMVSYLSKSHSWR